MNGNHKIIIFFSLLAVRLVQIAEGSVVSNGDFNKDFFVTWSPSHVNTSADGRERSLKLDQESGLFASLLKFMKKYYYI